MSFNEKSSRGIVAGIIGGYIFATAVGLLLIGISTESSEELPESLTYILGGLSGIIGSVLGYSVSKDWE